jgi:hypothetical protein
LLPLPPRRAVLLIEKTGVCGRPVAESVAILSVRPESLEMASCLNNLGAMYETQGRKQEAVQRTDESLRIYMKPRVSKQVTDIKLDYSGFEVNILYLAAIRKSA